MVISRTGAAAASGLVGGGLAFAGITMNPESPSGERPGAAVALISGGVVLTALSSGVAAGEEQAIVATASNSWAMGQTAARRVFAAGVGTFGATILAGITISKQA